MNIIYNATRSKLSVWCWMPKIQLHPMSFKRVSYRNFISPIRRTGDMTMCSKPSWRGEENFKNVWLLEIASLTRVQSYTSRHSPGRKVVWCAEAGTYATGYSKRNAANGTITSCPRQPRETVIGCSPCTDSAVLRLCSTSRRAVGGLGSCYSSDLKKELISDQAYSPVPAECWEWRKKVRWTWNLKGIPLIPFGINICW